LFNAVSIQNGLKQEGGLVPLFFNFCLKQPSGRSKKIRGEGNGIEWNMSASGILMMLIY